MAKSDLPVFGETKEKKTPVKKKKISKVSPSKSDEGKLRKLLLLSNTCLIGTLIFVYFLYKDNSSLRNEVNFLSHRLNSEMNKSNSSKKSASAHKSISSGLAQSNSKLKTKIEKLEEKLSLYQGQVNKLQGDLAKTKIKAQKSIAKKNYQQSKIQKPSQPYSRNYYKALEKLSKIKSNHKKKYTYKSFIRKPSSFNNPFDKVFKNLNKKTKQIIKPVEAKKDTSTNDWKDSEG